MTIDSPKVLTLRGRLSFPTLTAQEAYDRSLKGQYPAKDVASAKPDFQLLVDEDQWAKFYKHATEVFLPYCAKQAKGENDHLTQAEVKELLEALDGDLADQRVNTPAKPVAEQTQALAPEVVASIKCIGPTGGEIGVKAYVSSEAELSVPDPDRIKWPAIVPIGTTVHDLYPGCMAMATISLYSYRNGKRPGFSARATTVVFRADADRFGGGVDVDEDAMLMD